MKAYKVKTFEKWAKKNKMSDKKLIEAANEIADGIYEASLGGHIFKKRIASSNKGKSGGFRTIVAYKNGDVAFFLHGFSKGMKSTISDQEESALKDEAEMYLDFDEKTIKKAVQERELFEVSNGQKK